MIKIGRILEGGSIEKEYYNSNGTFGEIFKDEEAFNNKKGICYSPELSDETYTYEDYIAIAKYFLGKKKGDIEKVARMLFDYSEWQHPETLADEWEDDLEEYPETYGAKN